jgi:hypothetical protein
MSDSTITDSARKAAEEIVERIKKEAPDLCLVSQGGDCRDFKGCADHAVNALAAVIERHWERVRRCDAFESMANVMREAAVFKDESTVSPRIVGVAYFHNGQLFSLPRPARHCHLVWAYGDMPNSASGFVTNNDWFVGRKTAWRVADKADQIIPREGQIPGTLYSEDVW